jgi:hypothetical protein
MLHLQLPTYQTCKIKRNAIWALAHNTLGVSQGQAYFAKSMPPLGILRTGCQYDITFEVKKTDFI